MYDEEALNFIALRLLQGQGHFMKLTYRSELYIRPMTLCMSINGQLADWNMLQARYHLNFVATSWLSVSIFGL